MQINKTVKILGQDYSIKAIIVHSSYNTSGHYFTHIYRHGTWFTYNDAAISYAFQLPTKDIEYAMTHAVVFLYQKSNTETNTGFLSKDDFEKVGNSFVRSSLTQHEDRLIKSINPDDNDIMSIKYILEHSFKYDDTVSFSDCISEHSGKTTINLKKNSRELQAK